MNYNIFLAFIIIGFFASFFLYIVWKYPVSSEEKNLKDSSVESSSKEPLTENRLDFALEKTRTHFFQRLKNLFTQDKNPKDLKPLWEILVSSDVSTQTADFLIQKIEQDSTPDISLLEKLQIASLNLISSQSSSVPTTYPHIILMVGVNGTGKTTSSGKLAKYYQDLGYSPVLGAADTFRAAATEQLSQWAEKLGIPCITGKPGSDPAAIAYKTLEAVENLDKGVGIIDTAGRLQTKKDLMDELEKIQRVLQKKNPLAPQEILLVIDGTYGQNALSQVLNFQDAVKVTGLIVTKLDGTAKGGMILTLAHETSLPISWIGFGESEKDLRPFDAKTFIQAILPLQHSTLPS
jgi:fused signal recognition particle receptor